MEKTSGSSEKASDKIIKHIKANPFITIAELAQLLGISTRAIEKQLEKLKTSRQTQWNGPDKGGYWVLLPGGS